MSTEVSRILFSDMYVYLFKNVITLVCQRAICCRLTGRQHVQLAIDSKETDDEPSTGLDPNGAHEISSLGEEAHQQAAATTLTRRCGCSRRRTAGRPR